MNETINANIGQQAFTLDRNAYDRLTIYLNDVRRHIATDTDEVMNDIEIRIAELFREWLPSSMMVVTLAMVERAIVRIGTPEDFGSAKEQSSKSDTKRSLRQLRRSRNNRSIAGICGGLGEYLGMDATPLRIAMIFLVLFGGMSLWVYIIMWLVIPEED
ncbi:MAG: PspC domain-containing protein [Alistipes sp.]|nr:PspC domain-containing protein [Alistipes sp.]